MPNKRALQSLQRLKEGNRRFADEGTSPIARTDKSARDALINGQTPHAIILGCSDSRVPLELIFDQGLGDLFVIRVAGNVVAPSLIGSIEFAADKFGTRMVVVMGHTSCGAVTATVEELRRPAESRSPNLKSIVDRIRPAVETLMETEDDPEELVRLGVRANVRASVNQLRNGSEILEDLILNDGLMIVGAEYSLETGHVEFFDDLG